MPICMVGDGGRNSGPRSDSMTTLDIVLSRIWRLWRWDRKISRQAHEAFLHIVLPIHTRFAFALFSQNPKSQTTDALHPSLVFMKEEKAHARVVVICPESTIPLSGYGRCFLRAICRRETELQVSDRDDDIQRSNRAKRRKECDTWSSSMPLSDVAVHIYKKSHH